MSQPSKLDLVETSVCASDTGQLMSLLPALQEQNTADTLLDALNRGIEQARRNFKQGTFALPDFLLAIDAYRMGTAFLKERFPDAAGRKAPGIVIGVVEGDVHDMGKNIVAAVLEACGFRVTDLGKNVPNETFLEAIEAERPEIVALSTMMSTTLENMNRLIEQVKRSFPDTLILVGRAPFDPELARQMGADGYAENVITIPDETRRVLTIATAKQLA
ncbi:MAG: cobalamin B12-binding domain-containing protein [Thermodesulfobacteriota bacterium]